MKLSYNWLKDYLVSDLTPQQIADAMTDIGIEVDSVEEQEEIPGGLAGVVIADAEFIFGADHAERLDSTDFGLFDLEVAREDGSYSGEEYFLPCSDVRGAADHGQRLSGTVIDLGDVKMVGIRMGCAL